MDKFNNMRVFVEVVAAGGFTAAADRIGLSRAQVSKSVMQLEAHLGARLLNRTTRRVSLTETGRVYYERARDILDDVDEMESIAGEHALRPTGTLRIAAPTSFGVLHLNQAIAGYLREYPDVQISLSLNDRFIDVVAEGYDLAVRIAEMEDSSLVARKVATCRRALVASPDFLGRHTLPLVPQDLAALPCLVYENDLGAGNWQFDRDGQKEVVRVEGPLCADNGDVLKEAALAGLGIALLPTFIVGDALRTGELVEVLDRYASTDLAIHAVFPSRRYLSAKVRTFIDYIADCFGERPPWDE